jgi:glycosyltransferase involved in cell wall biosynthesis
MRILFLTNMYPPHDIGGYEQICQEVAVRLSVRNHEIKVLTSRFGVDSSKAGGEEDVIRSLHLQADLDYYSPADFFFKRPSQERFNVDQLKEVLADFSPDAVVVWGMWLLSHNILFWLEQWMPGRVLYYLASYWPTDVDPHIAYWDLPARRFIAEQVKRPLRALALATLNHEGYPLSLQLSHVISCSGYVRDTLAGAGKISPNSDVLYIGIDPQPFTDIYQARTPANKERLRLLYFGRLIEDKGVHSAVEALGFLKRDGLASCIELTILGSGHPDYESRLRTLVQEFDIAEQVNFVGKVPRDDIPQYLKANDVFLFTSIWHEPFGRTIIEAMLAGLVVIGSDVGGSREIFSHYDENLLFPAGDARALADRIRWLLDNPEVMQDLKQRGRQLSLEHFDIHQMVDKMESHLFNLSREN